MLSEKMKEDLIHGLRLIFGDDIQTIILYGSVARNEATEESDIDIAIIMRKDMEEIEKEQFLRWSAEMDIQYNRVFSIVDIREEQLEKWGEVLPFYKNEERKVLFCGKQLKRTGRIPYGTGKRNAFSSGGQLEDWSV